MKIYPDFTFFFQAGFFFASFWALKNLMFPPVLKVLLKRQKMLEHAQQELKERENEGIQMQQDYQEEIRKARLAAQDIRNKARTEAAQYERETLENARQEEIKLLQEEGQKIASRREELQAQFEKDRSTLTRDIVSKLLGRPTS